VFTERECGQEERELHYTLDIPTEEGEVDVFGGERCHEDVGLARGEHTDLDATLSSHGERVFETEWGDKVRRGDEAVTLRLRQCNPHRSLNMSRVPP
jgi:hypothetical protein